MTGFIILIIILFGAILTHDFKRLKGAEARERIVYVSLLTVTVLMSIDCIWHTKLFAMYDWADYVFGKSSRKVVEMLKPSE
ncbi:hypothetical protein LJR153_002207 [Paenibacillus sp. LjRoot153]|uniref:hypothetical protein n=1 Tax=Paenibacillus sp. LjRoot153 TaxID=3342270 RepID=UPI003ECDBCBB